MEKNKKPNRWVSFIILTLSAGLIYRVPYLKGVFYDAMIEAFGISNAQIGVMMSVYSLTKVVIYIPGGIIADRFNNKKMILISTSMLAVLTFWYALLPSYQSLLIIQCLLAFSNVLFWVSFVKFIRFFGSENEQGSVFGYSEGIRAIANLVINFIALGVLNYFTSRSDMPLRYVLLVYGITYVALAILMFFLLPNNQDKDGATAKSMKDYIEVLKVPSVWLVAFLVLFAYSVQVASEYTTPYLTNIFGMTAVVAGVIATIRGYGIGIFAAPIIGKLADKVGSYSKTAIGLLIVELILAVIILLFPGDAGFLMPALVIVMLMAVVMYAMRGIYYATMDDAGVPRALTGTATGIISVIGYLPDFYMNMALGNVLDKYPGVTGYKIVFSSMVLFALLGIIVSFVIFKRYKKRMAESKN